MRYILISAIVASCATTASAVNSPGADRRVAVGADVVCWIPAHTTALYCFGTNTLGAAGVGHRNPVASPTLIPGSWSQIVLTWHHACGIRQGTGGNDLYCWGSNTKGQLGVGDTIERLVPTLIARLPTLPTVPPTPVTWVQVTAGYEHTCALSSTPDPYGNGQVFCWGANQYGQLGNGTTTDASSPVNAAQQTSSLIVAGYWHTCSIFRTTLPGGQVKCTGRNVVGELGDNSLINRVNFNVIRQSNDTPWTAEATKLAAGMSHTCAIFQNAPTGDLRCWGSNSRAQIGLINVAYQQFIGPGVCMPRGVEYEPYMGTVGWALCTGFDSIALGAEHTLARWHRKQGADDYGIAPVGVGRNEYDQIMLYGGSPAAPCNGCNTQSELVFRLSLEPWAPYLTGASVASAASWDRSCVVYDDTVTRKMHLRCTPEWPSYYPISSPPWVATVNAITHTITY